MSETDLSNTLNLDKLQEQRSSTPSTEDSFSSSRTTPQPPPTPPRKTNNNNSNNNLGKRPSMSEEENGTKVKENSPLSSATTTTATKNEGGRSRSGSKSSILSHVRTRSSSINSARQSRISSLPPPGQGGNGISDISSPVPPANDTKPSGLRSGRILSRSASGTTTPSGGGAKQQQQQQPGSASTAAATVPEDSQSLFVAYASLEYLLMEMVPLSRRVSAKLNPHTRQLLAKRRRRNLVHEDKDSSEKEQDDKQDEELDKAIESMSLTDTRPRQADNNSNNNNNNENENGSQQQQQEATLATQAREEAIGLRIEALGYHVGQSVVERFTRDRTRLAKPLDVMKFICRDLWTVVFKKPVDNLKTNHRGVYILTDNNFKLFQRMSTSHGGYETILRTQPFLWFPCGLIRGALANLGLEAAVTVETDSLPSVAFQIHTVRQ